MSAYQWIHGLDKHGGDLHRPAALVVHVPGLIEGGRQQRDGRASVGVTHPDGRALVMEIEAEVRVQRVAHRLEGLPFGRLEPAGVTVDVDALGVPPLEAFGSIGIQHGDHVDGGALGDAPGHGVIALLMEESHDVHQRHGRGAFVAVHLGPQQHGDGSGAERQVTDLPPFGAPSHHLGAHVPTEVRRQGRPVGLVVEAAILQARSLQGLVDRHEFGRERRRRADG